MRSCNGLAEEQISTTEHQETSCKTEEWRRWDEEIVEDFGRWLIRIAKASGLLLLAVLAALVIRWLWG
jgi:hypothetical protein